MTPPRILIKWAGGKTQLLPTIDQHLPPALKSGKIKRYIEPFVGGGALFFHIAQHYPVPELILNDFNPELYVLYKAVQHDATVVGDFLEKLQDEYYAGNSRELFLSKREQFNSERSAFDFEQYNCDWLKRAALFIFLNKTCYCGLYRTRKNSLYFNTSPGKFRNPPKICDRANLAAVSQLLQRTKICQGDFEELQEVIHVPDSFTYFDPPYRPVSKTSNFNSYCMAFEDDQQQRLAKFCQEIDAQGNLFLASNSATEDGFFEQIYSGFTISRVAARRAINSNAQKRGNVDEILIRNYELL